MKSDSLVRVGVVGADPRGFGARAHIPAIQESSILTLQAICTNHDETAKVAAEKHGARHWYAGIESMLDSGEVDLVTIAVRPALHSTLALAAISYDIPVYCEWPLALNSPEAQHMARTAATNGTPTATGLQGRFSPTIRRVKDSLDSGEIGTPLSFSASLVQPPFQVDSDREWLTRSSEASGALFVASAHLTDMLQFLLGNMDSVVAVVGESLMEGTHGDGQSKFRWATQDTVQYLAKFEAGVSGTVNVTNTARRPAGFSLQILGDAGQVDMTAPEYPQITPLTAVISDRSGQVRSEVQNETSADPSPSANVKRALESFANSVLDGQDFEPDFATGTRLHHILDAIAESDRSEKWVEVTQP